MQARMPNPVMLHPDAIWNEAVRHYEEAALGALLPSITAINVWNRLNVATKQVAGVWKGQGHPHRLYILSILSESEFLDRIDKSAGNYHKNSKVYGYVLLFVVLIWRSK